MAVEVLGEDICIHCGRNLTSGYGTVGYSRVCHPNDAGRPDCYHMITVYRHELPSCPRCTQNPYVPPTTGEMHDAMLQALHDLERMVRDVLP